MKVYVVTQSQGGEYEAYTSEIIDIFQNRKDAEMCAAFRDKETSINEEELPMTFEEWDEFVENKRKPIGQYSDNELRKMVDAFRLKIQNYHKCEIEEWEVK